MEYRFLGQNLELIRDWSSYKGSNMVRTRRSELLHSQHRSHNKSFLPSRTQWHVKYTTLVASGEKVPIRASGPCWSTSSLSQSETPHCSLALRKQNHFPTLTRKVKPPGSSQDLNVALTSKRSLLIQHHSITKDFKHPPKCWTCLACLQLQ